VEVLNVEHLTFITRLCQGKGNNGRREASVGESADYINKYMTFSVSLLALVILRNLLQGNKFQSYDMLNCDLTCVNLLPLPFKWSQEKKHHNLALCICPMRSGFPRLLLFSFECHAGPAHGVPPCLISCFRKPKSFLAF
jgi:hypothetical protein